MEAKKSKTVDKSRMIDIDYNKDVAGDQNIDVSLFFCLTYNPTSSFTVVHGFARIVHVYEVKLVISRLAIH